VQNGWPILANFATPEGEPRRMVFDDSVLPLIEARQARVVPDAGEDIVDGIRFLPTPGHSIGHMAIELRSRGETALFCGDVMHSPLQVHRPEWNSTFCLDQSQARSSRRWLLEHAVKTGASVFPAHFPQTSAGVVSAAPGGFEWRYLDGVA
jgi:glyoxylase-like metal-dependent hydrolase (beta-lactamase superfamily II)